MTDPVPFMVCKYCSCLSFNKDDVENQRCTVCKRTLVGNDEYLKNDVQELLDWLGDKPRSDV